MTELSYNSNEDAIINPDLGRMAKVEFFGIALYDGYVVNDKFYGGHVGIVNNRSNALEWVEGSDDVDVMGIYL